MRKNSLRNIAFMATGIALFFKLSLAGAAIITFDTIAPSYSMSQGAVDITIVGQAFLAGQDATTPFGEPTTSVAGSNGGGLNVSWDASILQLTAVDRVFPGDNFFGSNGSVTTTNGISTLSGLSVTSFMIGTDQETFDIAKLSFNFLKPGSSNLELIIGGIDGIDVWTDFNGNQINPSVGTGTITVSGVPLPPALLLFGSSLLGMVSFSRRKAAMDCFR